MTDAPKSARIIPQNGAGARPLNSITFIPFKAMISRNSLGFPFQHAALMDQHKLPSCFQCCRVRSTLAPANAFHWSGGLPSVAKDSTKGFHSSMPKTYPILFSTRSKILLALEMNLTTGAERDPFSVAQHSSPKDWRGSGYYSSQS